MNRGINCVDIIDWIGIIDCIGVIDWVGSVDWGNTFLEWTPPLATLALIWVTWRYVALTKRILDEQTDPCVIVSLVPSEDDSSVYDLVIENIGKGMAYDVRFDLSEPIPSGMFSDDQDRPNMDSGPLMTGILALEPGGKRVIIWGRGYELQNDWQDKAPIITCWFKKSQKDKKDMPPMKCPIDIQSFNIMRMYSPIEEISERMKEIVHTLDRISDKIKIK